MFRKLSIAFLGCLLTFVVQAQDDSLKVNIQGIKERIDQSEILINDLFRNPSLRPFQYQHSLTPVDISYFSDTKDLYNYQRGKGNQGFKFNTESYQKDIYPNITLWGNASYENYKVKALKFNETSDFDIVFPYVTADSVGGDLQAEIYQFAGGIAKTINRWSLAGEAAYRANLSHRKRDPRPKNNSSDASVKLGASYQLNSNYALAADLGYSFYKQRNELSFLANLGRPSIYHFNGLASYNALLSGSSENVGDILYKSNSIQGQIGLAPIRKNGFFAEMGINQSTGSRTLAYSIASANDWTDQILTAKLGYFRKQADWKYGALAKMELQTRKGTEGLFNNNGSNLGYSKIAEVSSYRYYYFSYNLEAIVGQEEWSIKPFANFSQFKEQYLSPFREQLADKVNFGIEGQYLWGLKDGLLGITLNLQKQKLIKSRSLFNSVKKSSGIEDMLQQNYNYLIAEPVSVGGSARYDFAVNKQIKPFLVAEAMTASKIKQKYYSLTLGLMF